MAQEKVTRQELRDMHIGQTRIITLIEKKKIESARQTVLQVSREDDLEFKFKTDYSASAEALQESSRL